MAGHSKFKNIQFRKGAQDKKRAVLFSKLSKEITVAAKMGMPDPDQNSRLRSAIQVATKVTNAKFDVQMVQSDINDVHCPSSKAYGSAGRVNGKHLISCKGIGFSYSS